MNRSEVAEKIRSVTGDDFHNREFLGGLNNSELLWEDAIRKQVGEGADRQLLTRVNVDPMTSLIVLTNI